ncbi:ABC transporter ATP-binding protein [Streptomyces acidiscabies]|uniref:ABC transporter ATP-binding protein n=1 Tax=Streptomyces acidiscabies TaxID=42234 RepID=UPI0009659DC5|nr:ABC transporter ATP-binding protein [Streptomyces acidiscabies]GAV37545.1 putative 2-aminoethylphosphonate ABC transporter ATP-binding protein [Streptomyces acidiscabies]
MIRFDSVSVAYDGNTVLDALDLTVEPGEVMALLGPSGSGKTTALRAVAGFVRPSAGRVFLGERDVTDVPPYRRGIGMVVQQYALFPHMRVEDNVAFGLKARRADKAEIRQRVGEALELTGMGAYARRRPRELSGGQQQRVAIARALAIRPEVLLLDEPLSALDARLRSEMLAELARLHRELPDVTILYVTHDQVEALTLADRIAVLDRARLQACGTPRELYRAPGDEFTASFAGTRMKVDAKGVTGPATLCVRPHLVGLGEGPNQLTGPVREIQWRGATHRLYVEVAGHTAMADVRELRDPPVHGARVTLHFSPEDAVLLHD